MSSLQQLIESTIIRDKIDNWFVRYPWLTGHLGNPQKPVWFVGENPSLSAVEAIHVRSSEKTPNLQWSSSDGDRLFRDALSGARLKSGDPNEDAGWNCYITNAIKEPEIVTTRNELKRNSGYWKIQAERWLPVLQHQINCGSPKVIVALGGQTYKILEHMKSRDLMCPPIIKIHHYSYIMFRPEAASKRGPRNPERIAEFKTTIQSIAKEYVLHEGESDPQG